MAKDKLILEAIALKKCIQVTYNRDTVLLAPHILYMRNDAPHVDAIAELRGGNPPRERKLGCYKVDGLRDVSLSDRHFEIDPLYDAASAKYKDSALFAA